MPAQNIRPRPFNPRLIDNVAADVFWGYCCRTGYPTARGAVLDGEFGRLWSPQKAAELVRAYGAPIGLKEAARLYDETNRYLLENTREGQDINGTLYMEDFARCRPAAFFRYKKMLRRLQAAGDGPENAIRGGPAVAGALLLRTPLPAAVLLKADPPVDVIRVGDTRQALGFQKTMLLLVRGLFPLPPNPQGYRRAAHGVFQVPCPADASDAWLKLIPNATAVLHAVNVF
jgi:hypothetical protein